VNIFELVSRDALFYFSDASIDEKPNFHKQVFKQIFNMELKRKQAEDIFEETRQKIITKLDEMKETKSYLSVFNNDSKIPSNNPIEQVMMRLFCQALRDVDDEEDWDKDLSEKDPLLPDNDSSKYWLNSVEIKYIGVEHKPVQEEDDDEEQVVEEEENQPDVDFTNI